MGPSEIASRVDHVLKKKTWARRQQWQSPRPQLRSSYPWQFEAGGGEEEAALMAEAERYLSGDYTFLNSRDDRPFDWHYDPMYRLEAPRSYAFDIDYRNPAVAGNVKNIWEKSRHHHLTVLAAAYALTRREVYAEEIARQLENWVKENPVLRGVNWTSALELGVRLISWVWVERLLRGSAAHGRLFGPQGSMWDSAYWHQWVLRRYHSHGSSANNHLIGEMAGLFLAACAWPFFPESKGWGDFARGVLEREIEAQTDRQGLNRELAFTYHIFSLEFFLLCAREGEWAGAPFSPDYLGHLRRGIELLPQIADRSGRLPNYGDGDDGMAVQLRPIGSSRVDWLYALGRSWLGAAVPAPAPLPLMARMLGAIDAPAVSAAPLLPAPAFEEAGWYIFTHHRGSEREVFLSADAGPLGFLSIAAHGHADALSFTLSLGGAAFIVDPGTYIYHADMEARAYFRSTLAHNTIALAEEDQSVAGGIFMWVEKANTKVLERRQEGSVHVFAAEHDGYLRLPSKALHRRSFRLAEDSLSLLDELEGQGEEQLEWRLHFSPDCSAQIAEGRCRVRNAASPFVLDIALDPRLEWQLLRGDAQGGWYSPAFNLRLPAWTLAGKTRARLPFKIETSLRFGESMSPNGVYTGSHHHQPH
jgi:hypothetical protein